MNEEPLNKEQSLELISKMILTTKHTLTQDFLFFILWGWTVLLASLGQFLLVQIDNQFNYLPWVVLIPLAAVLSFFIGRRMGKTQRVTTYADEFLHYVWISFGIALAIVLFVFSQTIGWNTTEPMVILLYAIATFVSGGILRFKPLIYGALCSFALAIISVFVSDVNQLLIVATSILISYLIPGYMMRSKYRREKLQGS